MTLLIFSFVIANCQLSLCLNCEILVFTNSDNVDNFDKGFVYLSAEIKIAN